jgi:hypothetical protein
MRGMKLSALGDGANEIVCNGRMRRMKMNALGEGAERSVFGKNPNPNFLLKINTLGKCAE